MGYQSYQPIFQVTPSQIPPIPPLPSFFEDYGRLPKTGELYIPSGIATWSMAVQGYLFTWQLCNGSLEILK